MFTPRNSSITLTDVRSYRGAVIVVSHDEVFLGRFDLAATVILDETGALTDDASAREG